MVRGEAGLTRKKIIPIGYSHVKLFDVANQGHCYIVNSLRTWEYPIGDPVQILNWFLTWKWGCVPQWPEVIFFLVNPASPRTISIDKKKISSGTQGKSALKHKQMGKKFGSTRGRQATVNALIGNKHYPTLRHLRNSIRLSVTKTE